MKLAPRRLPGDPEREHLADGDEGRATRTERILASLDGAEEADADSFAGEAHRQAALAVDSGAERRLSRFVEGLGGIAHGVRSGSTLGTPATIRTGHDGFIELRQGATTAAIAADTRVDLPAVTASDGLIDHIAQPTGNVLYDVAKRPGRKLRIETPYLVAVVKGTRFNIAAQDQNATISLLEGQLEIWTPDESDVIQLNAGEIATRSGEDSSIRVLGMATGGSLWSLVRWSIEGSKRRDV